ncbi:MAG: hypothetical protein Q8K18_02935 [Burkholderiales bacterium]|nr:hypothetical protein [Burkholderiales bacterium]
MRINGTLRHALRAWIAVLSGLAAWGCGAAETADLVVRDETGHLSAARLEQLAQTAQSDLGRIVAFWEVTPRVAEFGKIHVVFENPRKETYSAVFYWAPMGKSKIRTIAVFGVNGTPQMLAHKLTHAVFPNPDKLIRNMMGIPMEVRFGNKLTFPMCGFDNDAWVLALRRANAYIPLAALGSDHGSWGMSTQGLLTIVIDAARQHASYAEAGSFGTYLLATHGMEKVRTFNRLSRDNDRHWQEVFAQGLPELEKNWLRALEATAPARASQVTQLSELLANNPMYACARAQQLATQ